MQPKINIADLIRPEVPDLVKTDFFHEEYICVAQSGKQYSICVPVRHGSFEKDNHSIACYIAEYQYPTEIFTDIIYV